MAKQKYALNKDEKIVLKENHIKHGFWSSYTDTLVITNQAVILERYTSFNNYKGIIRYPLCDIKQAIIGVDKNGKKQIELYFDGSVEDFALQTNDEVILKLLLMAINDQMSEDSEYYDEQYYKKIVEATKREQNKFELQMQKQRIKETRINNNDDFSVGIGFIGGVAKNVLKSGNISFKGIEKAAKHQMRNSVLDELKYEILDDLGIYDLREDFLEEFGFENQALENEIIQRETRHLEKIELQNKRQEIFEKQVEISRQQVQRRKKEVNRNDETNQDRNNTKTESSLKEQVEILRKLKELLDLGILSQEEFEIKKKEITNTWLG